MTTSTETQTAAGTATSRSSLPRGAVVAGRYTVEAVLGGGGMSTVYAAHDALVNRKVALKILDARADPTHVERFRREVVAGQEGHPNLVTTYDAGVWEDRFFIVMELASGRSLREHIADNGPLRPVELDRLVEDLLRGLDHLHTRGITHRDVKAGNVLINDDGTAKLADFGLARIPEDHTVTATREGMGTPAYMAPEQILGDPVGPPADLYSLGVLLYEAATGHRPFSSDSQAAMIHQHLKSNPDVTLLRGVQPRLRNLVLRLLEKNPERRYADSGVCLEAWKKDRVRRPLPRRRIALASILLAVVAITAAGIALSADAVRTRLEGPNLHGVSRFGTNAWTLSFPGTREVVAVPATLHTPAGFLISHMADTLDPWSSHIELLDREGITVFDLVPADNTELLRNHGFSGALIASRLLQAADVDGDDVPDLLVVLYGAPWYFSAVVQLQPSASPVGLCPLIFNPGIIEWAEFADADRDGEPEWYVAAMNNELLHTACVYRVDAPVSAWPPPRLGTEPAFPSMMWFNLVSRRGGTSFRSATITDGGGLEIVMKDGAVTAFDAWGNAAGNGNGSANPKDLSAQRLERYDRLSAIHLLLLDHDIDGASRLLADLEPESLADDSIAPGFRLFLKARLALYSGDLAAADRLAAQSFAEAPISNDALMLAVTARLIDHRWGEVRELIAPDASLTMGSPADAQEVRGLLAWLEGNDDEAWELFAHRGKLPYGLGAQHRARQLIGQGRFEDAVIALDDRFGVFSRERLDLLKAIALGHLGRYDEARQALEAELDRHPWQHIEAGTVRAWLACREGGGAVADLQRAVAGVRNKATWDLAAFLDLPLLLAGAADAALALGRPELAARYLDEAERAHPGLAVVADVRQKLGG